MRILSSNQLRNQIPHQNQTLNFTNILTLLGRRNNEEINLLKTINSAITISMESFSKSISIDRFALLKRNEIFDQNES